jgi:putative flippase GtrA
MTLVTALVADRRVRYLFAGGVAALVFYGVFSAGWLLAHGRVPYLALVLLANLVTAVTTYPLYRRGVFRSAGPWLPGFLRFYAVCFWSLVFNLVSLPLLVEVAHVPVLPAQAIVIVAAPLLNYQVNRFWTFKEVDPSAAPRNR